MKKSNFLLIASFLLIAFFAGVNTLQAQEQKDDQMNATPESGCMIPDLTDSQRAALKDLRLEHQKKMMLFQAKLEEKKAALNTLRLADRPDTKAINQIIDEFVVIQGDLMKEKEAHMQSVKSKLTDEQKLWFNAHHSQGMGPDHGRQDMDMQNCKMNMDMPKCKMGMDMPKCKMCMKMQNCKMDMNMKANPDMNKTMKMK